MKQFLSFGFFPMANVLGNGDFCLVATFISQLAERGGNHHCSLTTTQTTQNN
jgi:hypothetical protein